MALSPKGNGVLMGLGHQDTEVARKAGTQRQGQEGASQTHHTRKHQVAFVVGAIFFVFRCIANSHFPGKKSFEPALPHFV